jgi:hypothetical protein
MKIFKQTIKILAIIANIFLIGLSIWYTIHLLNLQNPGGGALMTVLDIILIGISIIIPCNEPGYFLFHPKLGKSIYHKCGEFYVDIKGDYYSLYDDKILVKDEICRTRFSEVSSEKQLLLKFKEVLDKKYEEKLKIQEKKDFLLNSDGYVDAALRREKRINKIL